MNTPSLLPGAFLGKSGQLYIRVRRVLADGHDLFTTQTAVYPSVASYNTRSAVPHYVELSSIADDYLSDVRIDLETLTISVEAEPAAD